MTLQVFSNEAARRSRQQLEEKIADVYAEYLTLQHDLSLFEQRYLNTVGELLLTRDELLSRIAALDALSSPQDPQRQQAANEAAARSRETQDHVNRVIASIAR